MSAEAASALAWRGSGRVLFHEKRSDQCENLSWGKDELEYCLFLTDLYLMSALYLNYRLKWQHTRNRYELPTHLEQKSSVGPEEPQLVGNIPEKVKQE